MKKYHWLLILLFFTLSGVGAQGQDLKERVEQARRDEVPAADITRWLIGQGERAEEAVQVVVQVYGNCPATIEAVQAATAAAPRHAESIVVAVAGLDSCGCSADDTSWALGRVDNRLRLPLTRRLLELEDREACAAAAVQGAVFELPERSGSLVEAALIAKQGSLLPEDSIGSISTDRKQADWSASLPESAAAFRRRVTVCRGDHNPRDPFVATEQWEVFDPAGSDPRSAWRPDCEIDEQREDDEDLNQVLIAEFVVGRERPNYVKIYNGTDAAIRLDRLGYRLLISAPGSEVAAAMVPLRGEVAAGGVFVLGDERMPPGSVDQLAPGLSLSRGDALIVDLGWQGRTCDSIAAIVGGAFRAGQNEEPLPDQVSRTELIRHKLARQFGELEGQTPGYVADAVGQVPLVEREDQVPLLDSPLSRLSGQCQPDGNETNDFAVVAPWQLATAVNLGSYPPQCPPSDEPQLVISELVNGKELDDALEMFNGTPAPIDLNKGGYYLEIFRKGERNPSEVIRLDGMIAPGAAFVVANPGTDKATRELAGQVTGELDLADASAVLLVREAVPSARRCDQVAVAALQGPADVVFVPVPEKEPPIRVDPLASPN